MWLHSLLYLEAQLSILSPGDQTEQLALDTLVQVCLLGNKFDISSVNSCRGISSLSILATGNKLLWTMWCSTRNLSFLQIGVWLSFWIGVEWLPRSGQDDGEGPAMVCVWHPLHDKSVSRAEGWTIPTFLIIVCCLDCPGGQLLDLTPSAWWMT